MDNSPTTRGLLGKSISVLGTGLGPFISLALIVHIPTLVSGLVLGPSVGSPDLEGLPVVVAAVAIVTPILVLLLEALATAIMVYGVFQILRGAPLQLGECLRFAAARRPAVIGLAILVFLAVVGGVLLCVIPGFVVLCGLFVAMPALLVERLRVTEAMKRSWSLTDGHKTVIFFFLLVIMIVQVVPLGIASLFSLSPLDGTLAGNLMVAFLNYGIYAIATALNAVAATVAYHDLRVFREEMGGEELAAFSALKASPAGVASGAAR